MGLSAREAVVWLLPSDGPRSYNRRGASQEGLCQARPQNQNDQAPSARGATSRSHKTYRSEPRRQSPEGRLCQLRVVCPQPLLSPSQGGLASRDGERKDG